MCVKLLASHNLSAINEGFVIRETVKSQKKEISVFPPLFCYNWIK